MEKKTYTVDTENSDQRLDIFVSSKSGMSRAYVQKLIKQGFVLVNTDREKPNYKTREGDSVELSVPHMPGKTLVPEDIPLDVIWEDDAIIIINKPPHMVVHPGAGNRSGTLVNALLARCERLASLGSPLRPGVVHRLDKDTSGIIVLAKNDAAYRNLQNQFKKREVEKEYLALLYGKLKKDCGEITEAIGRASSDRKKMSTRTKKGREAITRYEVIKRFKPAALVKVRIITGRTHQVRVHFAALGHPVLGDKVYGKKTSLKISHKTIIFPRQMLHAQRIKFLHPVTKKPAEFISPVPEDMDRVMRELPQ
ncbi:RluA family pseudouridine synthase [bacterium]|nr:MAG: RluA family pseudouridine synthase [bacterium]